MRPHQSHLFGFAPDSSAVTIRATVAGSHFVGRPVIGSLTERCLDTARAHSYALSRAHGLSVGLASPGVLAVEARDGVELPSFRGDMVNDIDFTEAARVPDPHRMVRGYYQSAATLNLVRALAKQVGRNPREVAGEVAAAAGPLLEGIATMEIAGPMAMTNPTSVSFRPRPMPR